MANKLFAESHESALQRPPRIFLGGPFSAALEKDGRGAFRFKDEHLRVQLLAIIDAINSIGVELLNSHLVDGWGEIDFVSNFVERDFGWVQDCDVYVALLPSDSEGLPYRTDGTFLEIGYALAAGKEVVLLVDDPDTDSWSFFVRDLLRTDLVRLENTNDFLYKTEEILLNGLLRPERADARQRITDVKLWNWFQNRATISLPVQVGHADLIVHPGVMNPRFTHSPDFLMSFWKIPQGARVLDLGCGSGVSGINALLEGAGDLVAADLNPAAVRNTAENLIRNNVENRGCAVLSDAFSNVSGTFDVILFNPPYWEGDGARTFVERASYDTQGHGFLRAVLTDLSDYLSPNGRCFIAYSDQGDTSLLSKLIEQNGLVVEALHIQRPDQIGFHVRVGWEIRK